MTATFHDISDLPNVTPPPGEEPLCPALPVPPVAWVGGRAHVLVRMPIADLEGWRAREGLELDHVAWFGRLGRVSVNRRIKHE